METTKTYTMMQLLKMYMSLGEAGARALKADIEGDRPLSIATVQRIRRQRRAAKAKATPKADIIAVAEANKELQRRLRVARAKRRIGL
jgi:hypothetical protein